MYNQFTEQELQAIYALIISEYKDGKKSSNLVSRLKQKVENELYSDEKFIEFFSSHDNDILYIYKYKSEARYKIIVNNISTKHVKELYELYEKFHSDSPNLILDFLICSLNEQDIFDDNLYLVYERRDNDAEKEK